MRISVINADKSIGIDGEFYSGLSFDLPSSVHAIQWYGTWGELEYSSVLQNNKPHRPENTVIHSFDEYSSLIAVWTSAKTAKEAKLQQEIEASKILPIAAA